MMPVWRSDDYGSRSRHVILLVAGINSTRSSPVAASVANPPASAAAELIAERITSLGIRTHFTFKTVVVGLIVLRVMVVKCSNQREYASLLPVMMMWLRARAAAEST